MKILGNCVLCNHWVSDVDNIAILIKRFIFFGEKHVYYAHVVCYQNATSAEKYDIFAKICNPFLMFRIIKLLRLQVSVLKVFKKA